MKDKSDKTIRILLADASRLTTLGITQVLEHEADMEIVGVATDGEDAVAKAGELEPDILIIESVSSPGSQSLCRYAAAPARMASKRVCS